MEPSARPTAGACPTPLWRRTLLRVAVVLSVLLCLGFLTRQLAATLERRQEPAGFPSGFVQGALMPAALPYLLIGRDVVIYAPNNTGVAYKLGYTLGVNACGALFFGILFWRFSRWRQRKAS
jgi:hypothetical protein